MMLVSYLPLRAFSQLLWCALLLCKFHCTYWFLLPGVLTHLPSCRCLYVILWFTHTHFLSEILWPFHQDSFYWFIPEFDFFYFFQKNFCFTLLCSFIRLANQIDRWSMSGLSRNCLCKQNTRSDPSGSLKPWWSYVHCKACLW